MQNTQSYLSFSYSLIFLYWPNVLVAIMLGSRNKHTVYPTKLILFWYTETTEKSS